MTFLAVDPNSVAPGYWPLILIIILGAVMVLLFLSMRKQLRRINVPRADEQADTRQADETQAGEAATVRGAERDRVDP